MSEPAPQEEWPPLPFDEWKDTLATLHRWTQMVGKTRLALAPMTNHWWQVTLYLTARGLTTSPMPVGQRTVEIEFDFLDHVLAARTSDGASRRMRLAPRSVADFHREYRTLLRSLDVEAKIWPVPVEMPEAVPFTDDVVHASYDAGAAHRCFRVLAQADRVLKEFRGGFLGKCSPVHFWWGGFDLSCTRFSGRRAPLHPAGLPNLADRVTREAYSHECVSAGWWPGGGVLREPAFYAYAYAEPAGLSAAAIRPREAYYHRELREFILPYDALRTAARPDEMLLAFLQSTYEAGADLLGWDRAALERGLASSS
ncbi:MAG: hypothetical protein E6J64_08045 [Deltaproteobacteria bacterium]|nr:MAG: hypothetical protein E6J64_08045 [Deltaproteobacteria bacterium]